jgi:hypothetical protein
MKEVNDMWTDESRIALEQGVTMTESNGEALLFDEAQEQVVGVDGPAAEAMLLLGSGKTFGEATRALLRDYEVAPEVLERDVGAVLDAMVERRILRRLG